VAEGRRMTPSEVFTRYESLLIEALRMKTTLKKNMNVLQHIMGYFKQQLDADEKQEILEILDHYRREVVPLIVPITLLNHYVRKFDQPYLKQQVYLNPHPIALKLRNHA
ncbi:MAG: YbgA family protein, partial [Desulfobacterales bacterium]